MMTEMSIGIIGFGRFGRLAARYLAQDNDVHVYDRNGDDDGIKALGCKASGSDEVCTCRLVVLCVPISAMKETLKDVAEKVSSGTIVIDVCSVKVYPSRWMEEILPDGVGYLATHPFFGPDSAKESLEGRKIVLCRDGNRRLEDDVYAGIKDYLISKGLNVIETSAEEHDRQAAQSLSLTHFIGRSLERAGTEKLNIDTEGYKRLRHILETVNNDTWELFIDMHKYNPYAKETRQRFINAMMELDKELGENDE